MKPIAVIAALILLAVPVRAEDDPKKAAEAFQGEWKFISFSKSGEEDSKEELAKAKLVVSGDKMTFTRRGKDDPVTFTLDPKATPATIDLKAKEGGKEIMVKGIYKLEKDTLTICFGLDASERPKDFKPAKGNGLLILERVKK